MRKQNIRTHTTHSGAHADILDGPNTAVKAKPIEVAWFYHTATALQRWPIERSFSRNSDNTRTGVAGRALNGCGASVYAAEKVREPLEIGLERIDHVPS